MLLCFFALMMLCFFGPRKLGIILLFIFALVNICMISPWWLLVVPATVILFALTGTFGEAEALKKQLTAQKETPSNPLKTSSQTPPDSRA